MVFRADQLVHVRGVLQEKVDEFLAGGTVVQTFNGTAYDIGTTVNTGKGNIKGFRPPISNSFSFLPGALKGLGSGQLHLRRQRRLEPVRNHRIGDPDAGAARSSKHGTIWSGWRRRGRSPLARLAMELAQQVSRHDIWQRRERHTAVPEAYASLDSSISYNINEHFAFSVDTVNLTNRMNVTYIGTTSQYCNTRSTIAFGFSFARHLTFVPLCRRGVPLPRRYFQI